ncbi:MAG: ABC transporter permease [Clostridia bacterium]|nr:ABC transporter permease [Clostridia bacterium]
MGTIFALWMRSFKLFVRDKTRLILSTVFPFFFVYVISAVFKNEFIESPVTYMLAGVVVSTLFDYSLRISASTIDDMASGFMKEVLVSPISRLSVAAGQFLASATIAAIQGLIIIIVGFCIGLRVTSPLTAVYMLLGMVYIGLVFSGFGLFIATKTKNTQTFQVMTMAITTPMTFISGAYIPFSVLPTAIKYIGRANPMTYAVALFRAILLEKMDLPQADLINEELAFKVGNFVITPYVSLFVLAAFGALFLALATLAFVRLDFSKINRNKVDAIEW